jgi:hypothetical protein
MEAARGNQQPPCSRIERWRRDKSLSYVQSILDLPKGWSWKRLSEHVGGILLSADRHGSGQSICDLWCVEDED